MAASIVELCKGIRDALNSAGSGAFTESFTSVFEYSPAYTIPDTETFRVVVTDAGGLLQMPARRLLEYADSVKIVLMFRVADDTNTGLDEDKMEAALLTLEEIGEFLFKKEIGDYKQTGVIVRGDGEKDKQHYYPGNLDQGIVFASSLTVDYTKKVSA